MLNVKCSHENVIRNLKEILTMLRRNQTLSIIFFIICISIFLLCKESYADQLKIAGIVTSPSVTGEIPAGSDPIALKIFVKGGEPLRYEWKLEGPGQIKGPIGDSVLVYIPPEQIDEKSAKVIILVKVSDNKGQEVTASVIFTIISTLPPMSTPTPTLEGMSTPTRIAIGVGTAVALGVGVYMIASPPATNGEDTPSIQITSPVEGSQVDWITDVYGVAIGFKSDYYVTISVQPYDMEWYPQSNRGMIASDANWVVPGCYFGREGEADIGYNFRFRAELRDGNGQVRATDIVHGVTRK